MGVRFYALRPGTGSQREAVAISIPWSVALEVTRRTGETIPRAWKGTEFEVVEWELGRPERGTLRFRPDALARLREAWEPGRWRRRAEELDRELLAAARELRPDDPSDARALSELDLIRSVLGDLMGFVRQGSLLFLALEP